MTRALAAYLLIGIAAALPPNGQATAPAGQVATIGPGDAEFSISHGGRRRLYRVHVPPTLASPAPVLIAFHGGGGHAEQFQSSAGLDAVSDRAGFLIAYPDGSGVLPRRLLTWNAGDGCCGFARDRQVDDVGFAAAVIEDLARRAAIDRRRIYATGHSNGGMMAHRLAADRADLIAAAVSVAGSLDLARMAPSRAVPILQIHSVDDPRALYAGGLGPPFPGTDNRVRHQPVMDGLRTWARANGCTGEPVTTATRRGAPGTPQRPIPPRALSGVAAATTPSSRTGA